MKTFIFTTDWHIKSLFSQNIEIENFTNILLKRIEFVLSRQVDFIIHGGDFFDRYQCDDINLLNKIIELFKKYNKEFYLVPGNHDLLGYEPKSLDWTSVRTLEKAGLIKILPPKENKIHDIPFYIIYPTKEHDIALYKNLKNVVIISHNLISPEKLPYKTLLTEEISKVVSQCIFLCGDYHKAFKDIQLNCVFLNPGPLISIDNTESGFLEIFVDTESFSFKYRKITFPSLSYSIKPIEYEIEELSKKIVPSKTIFSIEELVSNICDQLYPNDTQLKQEVLAWIKNMNQS